MEPPWSYGSLQVAGVEPSCVIERPTYDYDRAYFTKYALEKLLWIVELWASLD